MATSTEMRAKKTRILHRSLLTGKNLTFRSGLRRHGDFGVDGGVGLDGKGSVDEQCVRWVDDGKVEKEQKDC